MATSFSITELMVDESQYIEILTVFNEKLCVPIYRNGAEFGLQHQTTQIFAKFNNLREIHKSLHNDLLSVSHDHHIHDAKQRINDIFNRYVDEFDKINIDLMEKIYEFIEDIFELSYNNKIINMIRKLNFQHKFNDINNYKEEPQFISYILYLSLRLFRYINYYDVSCLMENEKISRKCKQAYDSMDSALYLLCLAKQISQCNIPLLIKNRVLVRLEKLNMEAGRFKKKQKKRLLVLFNDRILWCSILPNTTKKGEKYKYKGSYKIKDDAFQIKPFYYDATYDHHNHDEEEDESIYSTNYASYHQQQQQQQHHLHPHHNHNNNNNYGEQFGFKFGVNGNDKSLKIIVCSENQQQFWCKDINKCIAAPNTDTTQFKANINPQTIDLLIFERFIKHSTSWNTDKIRRKICDSKSQPSLLSVILSLFYDLSNIKLNKNKSSMHQPPPPPPIEDDNDNEDDDEDEDVDDIAHHQIEEKSPESLRNAIESDLDIEDVDDVSDRDDEFESEENEIFECSRSVSNESFSNETSQLKQELSDYRQRLNKLEKEYKMLQNENAKLCARNTFLNNRLVTFNHMLSNTNMLKHDDNDNDDEEEDEDEDDDNDHHHEDAAKYMKMISHKRKNSDSTLLNKSPSFLSTLKDDKIDHDEFYLNQENENQQKIIQSSKSRQEKVYNRQNHKKKPKKKTKYKRHRKSKHIQQRTGHRRESTSESESTSNHSND